MVSESEYELLDEIGRGSYGKVYRARHCNGEIHAIKVVELEAAEDELDSIQQEIQMLQAFNCPQLTRYYGSFIVGSSLWIVMEYLEGGSLQDLIKASTNNLDEATTQGILKEMLKALTYLHTERKIHRDVKAGNILVAADGGVRLADFGESVQLTHSIAKRQTFAGSPYWMAPEVIMAQDTYNSKADIWSLGITAIEMINGRPPYSDVHPMKAVLFIPTNPSPTLPKTRTFSKHFHNFLEQCLQRDPKLRPSAHDLLKHPFMKGAKPTDALPKLLESRRAAELMKNLFGNSQPSASPPPAAVATARKSSNLPAAAAAAIAAAKNAASNAETFNAKLHSGGASRDTGSAENTVSASAAAALVEWDFDDAGDTLSSVPINATAGIEGLDSLQRGDFGAVGTEFGSMNTPGPSGLGDAGQWGENAVDSIAGSEEAVTPKARGGGGTWAASLTADERGKEGGLLAGGKAFSPRRQGAHEQADSRLSGLTRAGQLLGVNDIQSAASLHGDLAELSRQARAEEIHKKRQGLGVTLDEPAAGLRKSGSPGGPVPTTERYANSMSLETPTPTTAALSLGASSGASPTPSDGRLASGARLAGVGGGRAKSGSMLSRFLKSATRERASSWSTSSSTPSRVSRTGKRSPRRRSDSRTSNSFSRSPEPEPLIAAAAATAVAAGESALRENSPSTPSGSLPQFSSSSAAAAAGTVAADLVRDSAGSPAVFSLDAFVNSIGTEAPLSAASSRRTSVVLEEDEKEMETGDVIKQEIEEEKQDGGNGEARGKEADVDARWASASQPGERREEVEEPSPVVSTTSNVAVFQSTDGGGGGSVGVGGGARGIGFRRGSSLEEEQGEEGERFTATERGEEMVEDDQMEVQPVAVAAVPEEVGGSGEYDVGDADGVPPDDEALIYSGDRGSDVGDGLDGAIDGERTVAITSDGDSVAADCNDDGREAQQEGQGDVLTPAFHRHLTPALCELWAATEDRPLQRQAVQDLAMAMERLDGCSGGELTLSFVETVSKSWPQVSLQADTNLDSSPPSPPP